MRGLSVAPPQVLSDTPRCVITGRREVLIEQHTGLFSYETRCVRVRTAVGIWCVTGEDLTIDYFGAEDLLITGRVDGVTLLGEGAG